MKRKNKIILLSTIIFLILVTLILITYGYYLTNINGNINDKSITTSIANLELTYNDGNGLIESNNIIPGENITTKTFSVENTGNKKVVNYIVNLEDVINTFEDKNDLKLSLNCTSSINSSCMEINTIYPDKDTLLVLNDIEVGEIQTYELKVDFIETYDDQSDNMNKIIEGNIVIKDIKDIKETENSLETVSGTDNVILDNPKLIKNYRIYGNSIQNGTPSPDNPIEVQSVGDLVTNENDANYGKYKIPLKTKSINLLNKNDFEIRGNSCGGKGAIWDYTNNAHYITSDKIYVKPNTKYTLITFNNDIYWMDRVIEANSSNICTYNHAYYVQDGTYSPSLNKRILNFTTKEDTNYLIVRYRNHDYTELSNENIADLKVMLIEGYYTENTLPDYELYFDSNTYNIYLDEPLRKIGDYADYIDFENKKVIRNTKVKKFKEDENWYISGEYFALGNWDNGLSVKHTSTVPQEYKCNIATENSSSSYHFKTYNWQNVDWIIFPFTDNMTTLEEWKTYVRENNVYVVFSLAKPEHKTIELPTISINEGTNIIEVDTTISPSKIDIEYLK